MIRRPPCANTNDTLFPYTTLFRSRYPFTAGYRGGCAQVFNTGISTGTNEYAINLDVGQRCVGFQAHILQRAFHATAADRSEEHTSELQSLMRISYAVFCLKKKQTKKHTHITVNKVKYSVSII